MWYATEADVRVLDQITNFDTESFRPAKVLQVVARARKALDKIEAKAMKELTKASKN